MYYRAIFLLLTLPGLCQLAVRDNTQKLLVAAILFLLWEAPFRDAVALIPGLRIAFWLCREGLWWWVAVEFGALNLAFLSSEINRLRREAAKFGRLKLTDR